jgi:hypothetical protein
LPAFGNTLKISIIIIMIILLLAAGPIIGNQHRIQDIPQIPFPHSSMV